MELKSHIQKIQNSLFELDCPLAVHAIEEELYEPELKYQILEWLFEKYKFINNETLDISISPTTTTTKKKTSNSSRLTSPTSSYSSSQSSLELRRKRETSPISKKKVNPLDAKITNLVNNCAILGCCNMKDATLFTEKTINSSILTIYENLIEMINISIYFDSLDNKEEENKIDNPLKYPRSGIKDIEDEVSKDVDFLNGICNSNNLSILSNKNCGNILSKDLTALVNLEKNENKKDTTQKNQKIDLEPLTEKIKKWNQEIENLRHEHDILKAQYKYADQDEDDNTQVLHSLYTLSQHLATYIESFNLRFPLEIESWIYTNPNINDQVYSAELGNVISRIKKLMKTYHQIIDNIANTRSSYEKLISKPNTTIPPISTIKKETSISEDYILDSISSSLASPISPFSNSYTLYQSKENLTLSHSFNQLNKTTLGGRINIDSEIKEIQQMENELQQSIDILMKSKERRIKNNPNLMQIELQSLSQSSSPSNLSLSSINTPISSKIHSSSNLDITDSNSKTKVINDNNNNTLSNTEKENNDVIIIEDSMDLE